MWAGSSRTPSLVWRASRATLTFLARRAGRAARDEVRCHKPHARRSVRPLAALSDRLHGQTTHLGPGLVDARQREVADAGQIGVVVAGERDVAGNRQAGLLDRGQRA